jgi:hypothetical protein
MYGLAREAPAGGAPNLFIDVLGYVFQHGQYANVCPMGLKIGFI